MVASPGTHRAPVVGWCRRPARWRGLRALATVGATAAVAVGAGAPEAAADRARLAPPASAPGAGFEVTGEVTGLYPGATTTLRAQFTNHQPFAIRVTSVRVTVLDAGPGCPASLLSHRRPTGTVDLEPGEIDHLAVTVHMSRAAPDACQGREWTLLFVATAVAEDGSAGPPPGTLGPSVPPGGARSPDAPAARPVGSGELPAGSGGADARAGEREGRLAFTGVSVLALAALGATLVAIGLLLGRSARARARGQGAR